MTTSLENTDTAWVSLANQTQGTLAKASWTSETRGMIISEVETPPAGLASVEVTVVEGNIGSGKTTLARNYAGDTSLKNVVVRRFKEVVPPEYTRPFYSKTASEEEKRAAPLKLQLFTQRMRTRQLDEVRRLLASHRTYDPEGVNLRIIMDRGCIADTIFAKLNEELGSLSAEDMQVWRKDAVATDYREVGDCLKQLGNLADLRCHHAIPFRVHVVFLQDNPNHCLKRKQLRNRPEEKSVSLSYLDKVEVHHRLCHSYVQDAYERLIPQHKKLMRVLALEPAQYLVPGQFQAMLAESFEQEQPRPHVSP